MSIQNSLVNDLCHQYSRKNECFRLYSSMELKRNIADNLFPDQLEPKCKNKILTLVKKAIDSIFAREEFSFFGENELKPNDILYIQEHFCILNPFLRINDGEAIMLNATSPMIGIFNIGDHIRFHMQSFQPLHLLFYHLQDLENSLRKFFRYAFSETFGFLTSRAQFCGSGYSGFICMHLPALMFYDKISDYEKFLPENVCCETLNGEDGNLEDCVGNLIIVRNTLSGSAAEFVKNLEITANRLELLEAFHKQYVLKDKKFCNEIHRAYGMLKYSTEISTTESWNCLSLCKLGIECGILSYMKNFCLPKIIINVQKAHIIRAISLHHTSKQVAIADEDVNFYRAQYIKEQLL